MWEDRLSPGSKRFIAWWSTFTGIVCVVLSAMCAVDAEWTNTALFLYCGLFMLLSSIRELRRAPR